ncbi:hypothetical protein LPTSP4_12140 [Leptospira ryugenii]|uniref:Uncharacterized protein n=1 Tax=Leptospira ryugenii TaxID=1917863 RepID=A0A2P2DYH9_9LEPT|nr:hypothetical protein [Leptospira ryugenii]GBF49698.1 hypothetical protein LPTSP4_12140 [Leptospira ryugenii]
MNEIPNSKRNFLDLWETYKYMNEPVFREGWDSDGRWDHGKGWVSLHIPDKDWRLRLSSELSRDLPEGSSH